MGMKLFGDEGGDAGDISKIEINQEFARRFEHNKKREDLQRYEELKKKGVIDDSEEEDDESSDDDDDDEDVVNYSTKQDLKFFDALIKVRNKDPSLKNNDAKLFDSDNDDEHEGGGEKKEKKKKPMFLKDVNAKHLIGNGPEFDDEDEERDDKNRKKSYFEEQEELKKEFLDAVAEEEDDDDDGDLLKVKDDDKGDEGEDVDDREFEKKLDEYFKEDDKLDENEKFLKDYFRKKMWLDKDDDSSKGLHIEIDVSEDEEELEKQEDYEREFNFRHEENAGDMVMGHSRKVVDSVRKKESSRKVQRRNKKERMAQAKFERTEELKRLKNLKKKEMNEKLRKIREIAGFGENGDCLLDEHDLEEEFDPEEYDKKMNNTFGDSFYEADDADPGFGSGEEDGELEKPNFDKEDDLLGLPKGWEDEYGLGDGLSTIKEKVLKKKVNNEGNEEQFDKKGKRKRSKLEEEFIKQQLEEIYKMDPEDTIGDLKTRFRYKSVDKNTYGLKAKEILLVDEKELNQIVPLKKLATYREDEFIVPRHKLKEHKQKIKSLLRGESSDGHSNGGKKPKCDVGQTETEESKSDAENEDKKELSRKQRRKMRSKELKISLKRRMAYEGSTAKSNKKRKHKSKDSV